MRLSHPKTIHRTGRVQKTLPRLYTPIHTHHPSPKSHRIHLARTIHMNNTHEPQQTQVNQSMPTMRLSTLQRILVTRIHHTLLRRMPPHAHQDPHHTHRLSLHIRRRTYTPRTHHRNTMTHNTTRSTCLTTSNHCAAKTSQIVKDFV